MYPLKSYKEEEPVTPIKLDDNEPLEADDMMFVPRSPRQRPSGSNEHLDSIVELNYEASSDEERLLTKDL